MDTEDFKFALFFLSILVFSIICLLFPIILAFFLSAIYFIVTAMFGFLCGFASGGRIYIRLTIFVCRPYDLGMNPLSFRIREFLAEKIEKIFVIFLIASSFFSILIELSHYGISFFPFGLLQYGVFISNLALVSNILILEIVLFKESDWGSWEVRLFLYILAATLFCYGILTFYRGIPEPLYPPGGYPEMYQLQKYFPFLCLSIFNIAASCGLSFSLVSAYCDIF